MKVYIYFKDGSVAGFDNSLGCSAECLSDEALEAFRADMQDGIDKGEVTYEQVPVEPGQPLLNDLPKYAKSIGLI